MDEEWEEEVDPVPDVEGRRCARFGSGRNGREKEKSPAGAGLS